MKKIKENLTEKGVANLEPFARGLYKTHHILPPNNYKTHLIDGCRNFYSPIGPLLYHN